MTEIQNSGRLWHVGVNAHLLSGQAGYRSAGIHSYSYGLLRHLPAADGPFRYTVFTGRQVVTDLPGMTVQRSRWRTDRPSPRIAWEQLFQPWALAVSKVDLHHGLAFVAPLACPCPFVVTVFDLSFVRTPERFKKGQRLYLQTLTRLSVRRAQRILAISESTAADVCRVYGIPRERIDVIYLGIDPSLRPQSAETVASFRTRSGLPPRFLLFVGTLEPRKNLPRLLEAYARLVQIDPATPPLFLAGGRGWMYDEIYAQADALALRSRVFFPGYVPADDLPLWYASAEVFVYPSVYEGFGLPIVEAMACGTPVVTTNGSSMPEAAGDAALLVAPGDSAALTEALARVLSDGALREELRQRGLVQAARFGWDRAAQQTTAVYRQVLERRAHGAG